MLQKEEALARGPLYKVPYYRISAHTWRTACWEQSYRKYSIVKPSVSFIKHHVIKTQYEIIYENKKYKALF